MGVGDGIEVVGTGDMLWICPIQEDIPGLFVCFINTEVKVNIREGGNSKDRTRPGRRLV